MVFGRQWPSRTIGRTAPALERRLWTTLLNVHSRLKSVIYTKSSSRVFHLCMRQNNSRIESAVLHIRRRAVRGHRSKPARSFVSVERCNVTGFVPRTLLNAVFQSIDIGSHEPLDLRIVHATLDPVSVSVGIISTI